MPEGRYAVLMDVDTGHDDAFAVLLAARHVDLLGITTVSGNAPLPDTTANTLKVLELAGLSHVPVAAGMDRPLVAPPRHAPAIHGRSGLDGPDLPAPRAAPDPRHGVLFMIETVRAHPGCWIVATGPLTNVAVALRQAPDLKTRLAGISLMGGSTAGGNSTAAAEFNIYFDPEAAAVVFESGVPIRMVGLNLTRQALVLDPEVARIRAVGSRLCTVAAELLDFYNRTAREVFGRPGGLLHDPCAVAWMIDPTLIEFQPMHVAVELTGAHTRGMTVCDYRFERGAPDRLKGYAGIEAGEAPNAEVGMRLDRDRFFDLLIATLASYR